MLNDEDRCGKIGGQLANHMIDHFQSAPSVADQKKYARQMEQQLLKDTPAIYSFFYNFIAATSPKVHGYVPDGIAVVNLRGVTIA